MAISFPSANIHPEQEGARPEHSLRAALTVCVRTLLAPSERTFAVPAGNIKANGLSGTVKKIRRCRA